MNERGLVCAHCGKQTLHKQETPNQVFHLLIVLFSCGLWLIPWLIANSNSASNPWRCSICGTERKAPGPAPAKPASAQERREARRLARIFFGFLAIMAILFVVAYFYTAGR